MYFYLRSNSYNFGGIRHEAYIAPCETSMIEFYAKIVYG